MQTKKAKALGTCSVCGQPFSANERLIFEDPQGVRHHTCPKDRLVNPDQVPVKLSQQRCQAEGICEALTEDHEHAPEWAPSGTRNLEWEEVAVWLLIVVIIIISVLTGYLLVAQIKNEFAKTLKSETAGAQSLLYGVAQKLIRATTLNALFEGQHPKFRPRLTAKKLRVREQVLGRQAKDRAWLGLQRRREAPSWRRVEC